MLKLLNRIGCNDSPFSLVNQQTESITEKFFKKPFDRRASWAQAKRVPSSAESAGFATFVTLDKNGSGFGAKRPI
ncbi:hypothetical protein II582_02515 [bacterium]|nr:hypothetical protein [bacterium]